MPRYIEKRRKRWYAVLDVPKDVRKSIGLNRFVQSLETESEANALLRAGVLVERWKKEISVARSGDLEPADRDALYWRKALREAATEEERETNRNHLIDIVQDMMRKGAPKELLDDPNATWSDYPNFEKPNKFFEVATGVLVKTDEHIDEYLASTQDTLKTKDMKRADIARLTKQFPYTRDIVKKQVRLWCDELVKEKGLKLSTVRRYLGSWRGYWDYLQDIGVAPEELDPFRSLKLPKKKNGRADERRSFESDDVVKLLKAAKEPRKGHPKGDQVLADLIALAMWTGARREELCALKCSNVKKGYFEVINAKTSAGWRQVPVHSKLKPTMDRLVKDSKDEYVLNVPSGNKYKNRGDAIGKRFSNLKTELGFGPSQVFHSIRKTVVTTLENAGVPEGVVADIVGHEKPSMTYGRYSDGATLETKSKALAKLKYLV